MFAVGFWGRCGCESRFVDCSSGGGVLDCEAERSLDDGLEIFEGGVYGGAEFCVGPDSVNWPDLPKTEPRYVITHSAVLLHLTNS